MNLGKQIHTLLKRQPSVYVKGLGTFRRNHQSASFDAKRHVYLPPITFIEFESDSSDGFNFVAYIQQIHQIDRHHAEQEVDQAVSALLDQLHQQGEATLDSLGYLVSYGSSYVFKPLDLSGFQYSPVMDEYTQEDTSLESDDVVVAASDEQEIQAPVHTNITDEVAEEERLAEIVEEPNTTVEEVQPVVEEEEVISLPPLPVIEPITENTAVEEDAVPVYEEETVEKGSNSLIYIIVAILASITLGGLYYYNKYYQQPVQVAEAPVVPVVRDTIPLVDSTAIAIDSNQTLADTVLIADTVVTEVPIIQETIKKYTIIIGTHKSLDDATRDAEAYHKKGHKSVKVLTPNLTKNNKRVVWDTYATKEERDSALAYVRKNIKPDAWPDVVR